MEMGELIAMDKSGRIIIPSKIRQRYRTNKFEIRIDDDKIELRPVKPLESLFGALPELDLATIRKEHADEVDDEHF
jgi:AbrB family looped-hinge helix DNA binding protein